MIPDHGQTQVKYVQNSHPMWEEHVRTVDPSCKCSYETIQNALCETLAIRSEVDDSCPIHGGNK